MDEAHRQLAFVYYHIGLLDEALQEAEKAAAINPTDPSSTFYIGMSVLCQGKYEQALHVWRNVPRDYNPSVAGAHTAWALFQLGRKDESAAKIEDLLKRYPEDAGGQLTGVQVLLLAASGEAAKAEDKIKRAVEKKAFAHFHHTAYFIACAYAQMNQPGPAIQWLQQAAEAGFPCYPLFERDPNLDRLRKDPRFIAYMAKLKERWEYYKATL